MPAALSIVRNGHMSQQAVAGVAKHTTANVLLQSKTNGEGLLSSALLTLKHDAKEVHESLVRSKCCRLVLKLQTAGTHCKPNVPCVKQYARASQQAQCICSSTTEMQSCFDAVLTPS